MRLCLPIRRGLYKDIESIHMENVLTVLIEAYVIADYERGSFSVSQCSWEADTNEKIVPILPPRTTFVSSNGTASSSFHNPPTIRAAIGGAVGGIVVLSISIVFLYIFCVKPRRGTSTSKEPKSLRPDVDDTLYHSTN